MMITFSVSCQYIDTKGFLFKAKGGPFTSKSDAKGVHWALKSDAKTALNQASLCDELGWDWVDLYEVLHLTPPLNYPSLGLDKSY